MKKNIYLISMIIPIIFGTALLESTDHTKQQATYSNVAVDKQWSITFNRSIDTSSVANNVYILNGTEKVAVTISVLNNVLYVKPTKNLENNKNYQLVVTNSVLDTKGESDEPRPRSSVHDNRSKKCDDNNSL